MIVEKEKLYEINDEDIPYDVECRYLWRTIRENSVTGVEWLQPKMEGKSDNSVSKQLQFLVNNDTYLT